MSLGSVQTPSQSLSLNQTPLYYLLCRKPRQVPRLFSYCCQKVRFVQHPGWFWRERSIYLNFYHVQPVFTALPLQVEGAVLYLGSPTILAIWLAYCLLTFFSFVWWWPHCWLFLSKSMMVVWQEFVFYKLFEFELKLVEREFILSIQKKNYDRTFDDEPFIRGISN